MIKIEHVEVVGLEPAIRGMRNPMNSWDRSDSGLCQGRSSHCETCWLKPDDDYAPCYFATSKISKEYVVGPNDLELMNKLADGGSVHAKYRRMIVVYMDITAPLYWWKEFDTYKIGTVANSCSTMHKIADKKFTRDDFSCEHLTITDIFDYEDVFRPASSSDLLDEIIDFLNYYRYAYLNTKDKDIWWQMIQLLPSSYNQKRTVMLNYEVLVGIYKHRKDHKLDEWCEFCKWIETLPYSELITGKEQ